MNEIEKLYENAELSNMWVEEYDDNQIWHKSYNKMIESMMKNNDWSRKVAVEVAKKECRKALPPFTAEKQLELICILNDFEGINVKGTTIKELKEELLKQCIEPFEYPIAFEEHHEIDKLYHKVQSLFKGGE